ncbi:MAG TPA: SDR family NAD(P)-dependent oxidoreductase [SAR324 cluster bacterium]|nr:short-chain dehydrogenase [Deltaproteobacteria bacterium]MDP6246717.1 SDR family NAD(P)-dependent oxidoreductase [SAR324 cluster bacterium]MDP6637850.1 SDR family NAD(P)-dependent oxidoreductase [SAR324 cluster bacterium]HCP34146.1 short-chain dehydrogenase [Deltaproteobacteria bacterium]HJO43337.1 SDR family NAD(P)-dependent oxidoreductase [SAR324 cluster bacterium]
MAKSVLITGGAKRLGKEMALSLAQKGWDVALHFRNSESDAETTRQRIEKTGVVCRLFQANLERAHEAVDMLRKVLKEFPELDLLVNNASVFDESPLATVDEEVFDRQFDVNFKSPFFMTQQYTKNCLSGHVVNILDTKIQSNRAGRFTAYNLSKKALMHLTQMSAIDLAPRFRVNAIAPGPVLKASHASEEEFQIRIQQTPLKLEIPGSSIVSALNYLIENPNLTGEILYCDNGSHLN